MRRLFSRKTACKHSLSLAKDMKSPEWSALLPLLNATHWISICLLRKRSGTDQWTSQATANSREPTPSQCSSSVCTSSSTGPSPPRDSNAAVTYLVSLTRSRRRSNCSNAVEEGDSERAANEEAKESGRAPGKAERANRGSERAGFTRMLRFSVWIQSKSVFCPFSALPSLLPSFGSRLSLCRRWRCRNSNC